METIFSDFKHNSSLDLEHAVDPSQLNENVNLSKHELLRVKQKSVNNAALARCTHARNIHVSTRKYFMLMNSVCVN